MRAHPPLSETERSSIRRTGFHMEDFDIYAMAIPKIRDEVAKGWQLAASKPSSTSRAGREEFDKLILDEIRKRVGATEFKQMQETLGLGGIVNVVLAAWEQEFPATTLPKPESPP